MSALNKNTRFTTKFSEIKLTQLLSLLLGILALAGASRSARADVVADMLKCQEQGTRRSAGDQSYCDAIAAYKQKNYTQSIANLNTAISQGNTHAYGMLGYMYETGRGVPANPGRAFSYYKQGAQAGNGDAMNEVARCYRLGIGVPKNDAEADRWLAQAKSHGEDPGPAPYRYPTNEPDQADFNAGSELYKAKNFTEALARFRRAAEAGNPSAELQIGYQYRNGEGVAKDLAQAKAWYSKAANSGNPIAQMDLAGMYETGEAGENWTLAAQLYQKSANQGFEGGEFGLGRCYEFGIGVPQNRAEAIRWFRYSGRQGNTKGDYFAKWLSEPTNFIGFRNDTESKYVMGAKLRYAGDFLGGDPVGVTFHNSAERDNFLIAFKTNADFHEAQTQWGVRHNNYQSCMDNHGTSCMNPGPPPAVPRQ